MIEFIATLPQQHIDWTAGPGWLAAGLIFAFGFVVVMVVSNPRKATV